MRELDKKRVYAVSEEDLLSLLESRDRLMALEAGGVDNWNWYDDSLRDEIERSIDEDPGLRDHIDTMVEEGNVCYEDDFWYDDLAKWELHLYTRLDEF